MEALRKERHYTYADYATWDDDVRYELIDGVPYMMPPLKGCVINLADIFTDMNFT
jgi:hypothetical protein